jgi:uncharacterized protein YfaP (DUF2135 family)
MNKTEINLDSVLAFNLVTKAEQIARIEADIENWKALQIEQNHSASAIRYYAELVYAARKDLARLKGEEIIETKLDCLCCERVEA